MEGNIRGAGALKVANKALGLVAEIRGFAREQKAAEPPLLTAERYSDDAAQDVFPLFGRTDPWLDSGKLVEVVETAAEVFALQQELALLVELDADAEYLPARIVHVHHFLAGVDVQVAD